MLRLCSNSEEPVTIYSLGFWSMHKVLEFGRIGVAQALGKSLTKAEAYRACFKDFLLNNRDATKAKALGSVLTRQERRYLKQAFRALPASPYPSASLSNEFWNYMDVEESYASS